MAQEMNYFFGTTETDRLNEEIIENAPKLKEILEEYLERHDRHVPQMMEGVRYYYANNTEIQRRVMTVWQDGEQMQDDTATNRKLASGWHKLLVDQKASFLASNPISIHHRSEGKEHEVEEIQDVLGHEFNDMIPELIKSASNKGSEWVHPFMDETGQFEFIRIPGQEVIPIYDNTFRKKLLAVLRVYDLDDDTRKVEYWTSDAVTYYEVVYGELVLDGSVDNNPGSHFYYGEQGYSWEQVPFVEFYNNEERVSDLQFYKAYIDMYDIIMSDTGNTLEDMQSLIYVLKNYEGQDLGEFIQNLKRYKAINVDGDGGVDTLSAEVPIEAVRETVQRLKENIIQFGQGVDTSVDNFGNNPSGVALKALYSELEMKAGVLERKFTKSLQRFMWFVCEYLRMRPAALGGAIDIDHTQIEYTFNKARIMNEKENADIAKASDYFSLETRLRNHPWDVDVEQEMERIKGEQDEYMQMTRTNPLDGADDSDPDEPPLPQEE